MPQQTLKIADNLTLPLEAVTNTFAILAKRGVGKTYTGAVLVEEMLAAKQQVVVADPIGVWWGLRSKSDGNSAGFSIVVFGGEHADVPLDENAGEVVAGAIVEHGFSAILDLSLLRKAAQVRFMTAFAEALYRLNRKPLHFVVDEADAFAPQRPMPGEQRLLGAFEDIVRRGRARGLGVTLITQRAAVLNKNVLTQIEVLVILRTISPQDREAIEAWTEIHGTNKQLEQLSESMASLPIGNAWFWSPGWLDIFKRVQVRKRTTFDSSSTPKVGEKVVAPKEIAPVDLETLGEQIKATAARVKENDPAALKKEIATLKRELAQKPKAEKSEPMPAPKPVEMPVLVETQLRHIKLALKTFAAAEKALLEVKPIVERIDREILKFTELTGKNKKHWTLPLSPVLPPRRPAPTILLSQRQNPRSFTAVNGNTHSAPTGDADITPAKQRILNGLAFLSGIGVDQADKTQLALIVGVSPTSGGYFNNLGSLRTDGLISYPSGGTVALTDVGRAIASTDGVPSNTVELHDAIRQKLPAAKWKILETLIASYPNPLPKDGLAKMIDVSPTSGGYFNNLGSLRSLGLIDYPRGGEVVALPILFID